MRLSLLTPPTDSPFRLPLTRGLPSERSFSVDTGALPRALPLVAMNPSVASAPMEALARFSAEGNQVSSQMLNTVLEAEVRKRDADDLDEATGLYTQTALKVDEMLEELKTTTDHKTLRPAWDQLWKEQAGAAMASASNPGVQRHLGLRLAGYRLTKSAEVSNAARVKRQAFQKMTLLEGVQADQKLATEAPTEADRDYHLNHMETLFRSYSRAGSIPVDDILKLREKTLDAVRTDRAYNEAFFNPVSVLKRLGKNEDLGGLETKEKRNLAEYAESRIRTLRADEQNAEAQEHKATVAAQDDRAIGWRQKISANYGPGGPGVDLSLELSEGARQLGKENYAELLRMHKSYREDFLKPPSDTASDPETYGRAQHAIITGRLTTVTQQDLLTWFEGGKLRRADYTHLSGLHDQKRRELEAKAKQGETEGEAVRKGQIKDAEKLIDTYLSRGNRMLGDTAATKSGVLVEDATTELHTRLQADPAANPLDVAAEMIERRIAQAEKIGGTTVLPYKTEAEVQAAYQAKLIDKATATRYTRIMRALAQGGAAAIQPAPAPTPPPSIWQRLFGTPPAAPDDVRKPVK